MKHFQQIFPLTRPIFYLLILQHTYLNVLTSQLTQRPACFSNSTLMCNTFFSLLLVSFWSFFFFMLKPLLLSVLLACWDWGQATKVTQHRWCKREKKTQMVKKCGAKVLFLFYLTKRKAKLFPFLIFRLCLSEQIPDWCLLCSAVTVCECLREAACVICCSAVDSMKPVCANVCVCMCVVTGHWCACSDCILWRSALNK